MVWPVANATGAFCVTKGNAKSESKTSPQEGDGEDSHP